MEKKLLLSLFLFVFIGSSFSQMAPSSAEEIMKDAFNVAKKENKKVFVIFHASWCGWCHKMDASMNDVSVKQFFDNNFVIRHLVVFESASKKNLENPGAEEMLNKYNGQGEGIPYWLVFDNDEKFIADSRRSEEKNGKENFQNTGCPATKEEVEYFIEILKKTTALKGEELDKIRTRFKENEQ